MTAAEMHINVDIQLQQVGSFVYQDFSFIEIDLYLNKAQDDLVRERTGLIIEGNNLDAIIRLAESDIRGVIKEFILLQPVAASIFIDGDAYEFIVPYPEDYWFYLTGEAGVTRTANPVIAAKAYLEMIIIGNTQLSKVRITPVHSPYIRYPYVIQQELRR